MTLAVFWATLSQLDDNAQHAQHEVLPTVVFLVEDGEGEEEPVNNQISGVAGDGGQDRDFLSAIRHVHGDDDPDGEGQRVLCVKGDSYAGGEHDLGVPPVVVMAYAPAMGVVLTALGKKANKSSVVEEMLM